MGLVSAINHGDFGKKSHSRNPLIFGLFARMHLVEKIGSGIIRMKDLMQEVGLPEPEFSTLGMFTICLKRRIKPSEKPSEKIVNNSSESLDLSVLLPNERAEKKPSEKTSEKILRFIGEDAKITIDELAIKLGKSTRAIELQLKKLKEIKTISRIGPDKGGEWVIKKR